MILSITGAEESAGQGRVLTGIFITVGVRGGEQKLIFDQIEIVQERVGVGRWCGDATEVGGDFRSVDFADISQQYFHFFALEWQRRA